jgi:hypothetical protein
MIPKSGNRFSDKIMLKGKIYNICIIWRQLRRACISLENYAATGHGTTVAAGLANIGLKRGSTGRA